ncbi:MAG: nucleotidyltransferase family protein [Anaerolineales bacterium]
MHDTDLNQDIIHQFVLSILRGRWDPSAILEERDLLARHSIDWEQCYQLIAANDVAPLVYSIIRDQGIFPPILEQKLQKAYEHNRVRNIYLFSELKTILRRFEVAGIPNILLKGCALSKEIYGGVALRPLTDMDLLVRPGETKSALRELKLLGYESLKPERGVNSSLLFENEVLLVKPGLFRTVIEIHWSLLDSPYYQHYLDMNWFWQTAGKLDFFGATTSIFSPEAQLLHLCAHLMLHHSGEGLLWQHDIAEVIVHYNDILNWDELFDLAKIFDLIIPTQNILSLVIAKWHLPVRSEILKRLNELQPSANELKVHAYLTGDKSSSGRSFLNDLRSMPDIRMRMRFILNNLFPAPTYMISRYRIPNSLLLPIYYPYRWFLGLRSFVQAKQRDQS